MFSNRKSLSFCGASKVIKEHRPFVTTSGEYYTASAATDVDAAAACGASASGSAGGHSRTRRPRSFRSGDVRVGGDGDDEPDHPGWEKTLCAGRSGSGMRMQQQPNFGPIPGSAVGGGGRGDWEGTLRSSSSGSGILAHLTSSKSVLPHLLWFFEIEVTTTTATV